MIASSSALAATAAPSTSGTIALVTQIDGNDEIPIMSADCARSSALTEIPGRDRAWMLEELRLSLFAQPLGAQGPISVQRIRKQLSA